MMEKHIMFKDDANHSLSADELLEKLGYIKKATTKNQIVYMKTSTVTGAKFKLCFIMSPKGVIHSCDNKPWVITKYLMAAILKKYAELGWHIMQKGQKPSTFWKGE